MRPFQDEQFHFHRDGLRGQSGTNWARAVEVCLCVCWPVISWAVCLSGADTACPVRRWMGTDLTECHTRSHTQTRTQAQRLTSQIHLCLVKQCSWEKHTHKHTKNRARLWKLRTGVAVTPQVSDGFSRTDTNFMLWPSLTNIWRYKSHMAGWERVCDGGRRTEEVWEKQLIRKGNCYQCPCVLHLAWSVQDSHTFWGIHFPRCFQLYKIT